MHLSPIATPSLLHYDYYKCHSLSVDYCAVCPCVPSNNAIELFIWLFVDFSMWMAQEELPLLLLSWNMLDNEN
jgi:hypothetical protein